MLGASLFCFLSSLGPLAVPMKEAVHLPLIYFLKLYLCNTDQRGSLLSRKISWGSQELLQGTS